MARSLQSPAVGGEVAGRASAPYAAEMRSFVGLIHLVVCYLTLANCRSLPMAEGGAGGLERPPAGQRAIDFVPTQETVWVLCVSNPSSAYKSVTDFLQRFEEPGDLRLLAAIQAKVDPAVAILADPALVQQSSGMAVFADRSATPLMVVVAADIDKVDAALAREDKDGSPAAKRQRVGGFCVSSARDRHWAFVGDSVFVGTGSSGRVALERALGSIRADTKLPDAPLSSHASYRALARDMQPAQFMLWSNLGRGSMATLDVSSSGLDLRHRTTLLQACPSNADAPILPLLARIDPNALLWGVSRGPCGAEGWMDRAQVTALADQFKTLAGVDYAKEMAPLFGASTWDVHWRDDRPYGLDNIKIIATLQVADPAKLQALLDVAAKRLPESGVDITRRLQTRGRERVTIYAAEMPLEPPRHLLMLAPGLAETTDGNLHVGWALAGNTFVVTLGSGVMKQQDWLWRPENGAAPALVGADLSRRAGGAAAFGMLRLGAIGRLLAMPMPPGDRARGTDLRLARVLERLGDCEHTSGQDGAAFSTDLRCRLSDQVDASPQRKVADEAPLPVPSGDGLHAAGGGEHLWVKVTDRDIFFGEERLRQWPCAQARNLRSISSLDPVTLLFANHTRSPMSLVWLDEHGRRVPYGTLGPGQIVQQPTFATHPWLLLDAKGRCRQILVAHSSPPPSISTAWGQVPADVTLPKHMVSPHRSAWHHTPSGRSASFVAGVAYSQQEYLSNRHTLSLCRRACWQNPACLGFFEQTHACPEPAANDLKTNPNETPNHGCYRICGFYDKGDHPLTGRLAAGPEGSVWLKADAIPRSHDRPDYAAAYSEPSSAP